MKTLLLGLSALSLISFGGFAMADQAPAQVQNIQAQAPAASDASDTSDADNGSDADSTASSSDDDSSDTND